MISQRHLSIELIVAGALQVIGFTLFLIGILAK